MRTQCLLAPLAVLWLGCGESSSSDAQTPSVDQGIVDVGSLNDLGTADSGAVDQGLPDLGTPDSGPVDTGVPEVRFAQVESIFSNRCSPCHDVGNTRNRVIVTDSAQIIGVAGTGGMIRVVAGDPQASWLYRKLEGTHLGLCSENGVTQQNCGNIMPPPPNRDPLPQAELETVRLWIEQGAL